MTNMEYWDKLKSPPDDALKPIEGGRLKGFTDINPQWRFEVMTEIFGPCGIGWKYEVTNKWMVRESESGGPLAESGEVCAFVDINLYIKIDDLWSEPIPGTGGSKFIAKERSGMHVSDECYKMALTDALSVAMKALGVASEVYRGKDRTKYTHQKDKQKSDTNKSIKCPACDKDLVDYGPNSKFDTGRYYCKKGTGGCGKYYKAFPNDEYCAELVTRIINACNDDSIAIQVSKMLAAEFDITQQTQLTEQDLPIIKNVFARCQQIWKEQKA